MYRDLAFAFFALLCMVLVIEAIRGTKYERVLGLFVMLFYIAGLVYFTMFRGGRTGLGGFSFRFPPPFMRAIISRRYGLTTNRSVLNMLLFIPFGCLLPYNLLLWSSKERKKIRLNTVVLVGLVASLIIESCQAVFKVGVFELDDLVKNTMGTGLGYFFFLILTTRVLENDK